MPPDKPAVIPALGPLHNVGEQSATIMDRVVCTMRLFRCDSDEPIVLRLPARNFATRVRLGERTYRYAGFSPTSVRPKKDYSPWFDYGEESDELDLTEMLPDAQTAGIPPEALEKWRPC